MSIGQKRVIDPAESCWRAKFNESIGQGLTVASAYLNACAEQQHKYPANRVNAWPSICCGTPLNCPVEVLHEMMWKPAILVGVQRLKHDTHWRYCTISTFPLNGLLPGTENSTMDIQVEAARVRLCRSVG